MPKADLRQFRDKRKRELLLLADILYRNCDSVCRNIETIYTAANRCSSSGGAFCQYSIDQLLFRLPPFRHSIPDSATLEDVTLELSIDMSLNCDEDNTEEDPFLEYTFDIVIKGTSSGNKAVICSWHLDRDIPLEEENAEQEFIHPYYHFHFGGRHMHNSGHDFGSTLILESPRIAHPPMDAILGVDFILTNYFQTSTLDFRNASDYRSILKESQKRIWKPYIIALNKSWHPPKDGERWHPLKIWPQILDNSNR